MKNRNFTLLTYFLFLQALVCISIVVDIPVVRQVLGFIFFIIVPGYLLLRLIRPKCGNLAETVLFSVGLSIALLSIIGVLVNGLGSLQLLFRPLSTEPMTIAVNIVVFVMIIADFFKNRDLKPFNFEGVKFWPFLSFLGLPILSIISVLLIRDYGSNILAISLVIAVPVIVILSVVSDRISSKRSLYYPWIIVSVVIALLLSQALLSNYQYGSDIQGEFETFISTKDSAFWNIQNTSYFQQNSDNAMVSLTVFPTVLSNLLNIDPGWIFKIVFPILFSLLPLGLYLLYRQYWSDKIAFLSVFFFVANYSFFMLILEEAKQMIGELFFVILFLILFNKEKNYKTTKWIVFIIAFFGLMVSHYSMNFMFLLFILFAWIGGKVFAKSAFTKIQGTFIVFSFCLTFLWYPYVVQASTGAGGPFGKFVGVIQTTLGSFFSEFFSSESRGGDVQAALGLLSRPSILHYVGTILYDLTIILIFIGFISLVIKWRKKQFDSTFFAIIFANMLLLVSAVVLPRFSGLLELGRLYEILLMFLAPLFILGSTTISISISHLFIKARKKIPQIGYEQKRKCYFVFTFLILVTFYLFQTGLIYEVTGDPVPSSITLSKNKMQFSDRLIRERDVFSATWISTYGDIESKWTFSDTISLWHVLSSYSAIDRGLIILLSNTTEKVLSDGTYIREDFSFFPDLNITYIYLSQYNVEQGVIAWDYGNNFNFYINQIPILNNTQAYINKIYSNGGSEIDYRVPP